MQLVVGLTALLWSVQQPSDDYAMSTLRSYSVHVEHVYTVEAESPEAAYDLIVVEGGHVPDTTHVYLTDDMGEEVEVKG